jgi:hypothetical protein
MDEALNINEQPQDNRNAQDAERLTLLPVRSIGRGNFDRAKQQAIDLRPGADIGPPFRHASPDRKRDRRPFAEMLDEVVGVSEAAV